VANINLTKYRKMQQDLEGAVERADMAENTLGMLRAKNRSSSVAPESPFAVSNILISIFNRRYEITIIQIKVAHTQINLKKLL